MKRILITLAAAMLACAAADAQSIKDILKSTASNVINQVAGAVAPVDLTRGTLTYTGAAVELVSDNALSNVAGKAAAGTVEAKVNAELEKAGIKAGVIAFEFAEDNTFIMKFKGKSIADVLEMTCEEGAEFFSDIPKIASRLRMLCDVGLGYIKLGQSSSTLSGGESQRIKLAYFLSLSEQSGRSSHEKILFIFDEPTTGLHLYDVEKLLKSFDALLDKGHTLVVVEHNLDVIKPADWVIDLGPDAGDRGGEVVFAGTPDELMARGGTFTADYLISAQKCQKN